MGRPGRCDQCAQLHCAHPETIQKSSAVPLSTDQACGRRNPHRTQEVRSVQENSKRENFGEEVLVLRARHGCVSEAVGRLDGREPQRGRVGGETQLLGPRCLSPVPHWALSA